MSDARAIAEETARASYGRLLAWLCSRTRDVAAAEDALADAFRAALETWPGKGVPESPEAWLLTAAKRKLIDRVRRQQTQSAFAPDLALAAEEAEAAMREDTPFPDERLKLLFICTHPAIDASIRSALMLQTVLGLDAARIASAFLVSPAAMSGRLVRAKRKIKAATIPFDPPEKHELAGRLTAVHEAIYAAYGAGWEADGAGVESGELTREAIYLARLMTELLPDEAEGWGLLALMLYAEARKNARRHEGRYVPLTEQDASLWDRQLIEGAETALAIAWKISAPGPYQLEAAIQSAHSAAKLHDSDTTSEIVKLYERRLAFAPTIGAEVGYAAALYRNKQLTKALHVLEQLKPSRIETYQAYWAVYAHVLSDLGKYQEALRAYDRAIGLSEDDSARSFLKTKKSKLPLS